MKYFFTADLHFNHANIIKYCNRPFKDVEEMNETIIKNWNDTVSDTDNVYVLGDFALGSLSRAQKILDRLKGNIFLVLGNHDYTNKMYDLKGVHILKDIHEVFIGGEMLILCHYAMLSWNCSNSGSIQLFGHSHGTIKGSENQMDVGVDANGFKPIEFKQIMDVML